MKRMRLWRGALRLAEDESAPPGELLRRLTCADAAMDFPMDAPLHRGKWWPVPQQWGKELSPTANERTRLRSGFCYSHP
jgi:hypothetical protein